MLLFRAIAASVILGVALGGCAPGASQQAANPQAVDQRAPGPPVGAFDATIAAVIDGDTFIATRKGNRQDIRVRLIGIDAPESAKPGAPGACHSAQATAHLTSRLLGRRVRAAHEGTRRRDRFGRDLWHVWLPDGTFVAGEAVRLGVATAWRVPPHVTHAAYLSGQQGAARAARAGFWGACPDRARS